MEIQENKNILNLVYDEWDESGNPYPNASIFYNKNWRFWMSEGLPQHYLNETKRLDKFILNRCKIEDVYNNPNEKFYYIIGNAACDVYHLFMDNMPFSDIVLKCIKECDNFFIVFRSEHEAENENSFRLLIKKLKELNIEENKIYVINNNSRLEEYKIKYITNINVHTLSFLPNSSTIVLNNIEKSDFIENKTGKFFMTFNKSPKPHRYSLLIFLMYHNILEDTNWSLVPDYEINLDVSFIKSIVDTNDIEKYEMQIEYLRNLPFKVSDYEVDKKWFSEKNKLNTDGLPHWMRVPEFKYNYENSYVNLTTESNFLDDTNTIHITEKSFKPFFHYQFPLILATHNHIKMMKKKYDLDFFDDIINHDYDDEPNQKIRFKKFINEVIRINENKKEFIEFYKNNKNRFENNRLKVLKNLDGESDYLFFKNLI